LGGTVGVLALVDVLGADTQAVGLTFAWPVLWDGLPLAPTAAPEVYLAFGQSF
jgi:hypothetical protein